MPVLQKTCCLLLLLSAGLTGCATVTPYQPVQDGYGYNEQRIENNRYRVQFSGNSVTPRETVENYLLYRAAELTLQQGYDYFVMTGSDTESDTRYVQSVSAFGGYGRYYFHPFSTIGIGVSNSIPVSEYSAQAFIVMHKGDKPATQPDAFDARQVRDNLVNLIRHPAPS